MLSISPVRRAVAAFFLLLFFAIVASAVCVAFGANAIPSLAPGANATGLQLEATLGGKPSAALQVAGSASRARVGT